MLCLRTSHCQNRLPSDCLSFLMHLWMLFADNSQKPSHFLLVFHSSRQPWDSHILLFPVSTTIKYILIVFYFWNHRTVRAHLELQLLQGNWLQPLLFRFAHYIRKNLSIPDSYLLDSACLGETPSGRT